jgi:hypothetical protein
VSFRNGKNILKRFIAYLGLFTFSHMCVAKVTVSINQQYYEFATEPRLVEVLAKVANDANWYWPATNLYRLETDEPSQLRNDIVARLKLVQSSANKNKSTQINNLIEQISAWKLAKRIGIKIDYDLAQTNPKFNPRFDEGKYLLNVTLRSNTFSVFGLVKQETPILLEKHQCAQTYIHEHFSALINKDNIFIIQPDGHTFKTGIAYWNAGCVDIMPGSQIYLPLEESQFFSNNSELNKLIVELALDRIVQ